MLDQRAPRRRPVSGRDGVFQVEDDGVGALGGLLVTLRPVGGAEQQGWTEGERGRRERAETGGAVVEGVEAGRVAVVVEGARIERVAIERAAHAAPSRHQTSTVRTAEPTTTPCWLRPVCSSVMIP